MYSLLAAEIVQSELLMTDALSPEYLSTSYLLPPNVRSSFEGQPPVKEKKKKSAKTISPLCTSPNHSSVQLPIA